MNKTKYLIKSMCLISIIMLVSCKREDNEIIINISPRIHPTYWKISSTPKRFSESSIIGNLCNGYNKAYLSWYAIEPYFGENIPNFTPAYLTSKDLSSHYTRQPKAFEVYETAKENE